MPAYGTPQAGGTITSIVPGDLVYKMFDGTETAAANLASVAIARGMGAGADNGATFYATGIPSGCTIDVQGSNIDVAGDYLTLTTMSGDANGNAAYTDVGRPAFYRVLLSAYTSGAMPVVTVQR